jgi:hypothetical protein
VIAKRHAAGAWHVLGNNTRPAGDVERQMLRNQPHLAVDAAAGRAAGEDRDGLASEIIILRRRRTGAAIAISNATTTVALADIVFMTSLRGRAPYCSDNLTQL